MLPATRATRVATMSAVAELGPQARELRRVRIQLRRPSVRVQADAREEGAGGGPDAGGFAGLVWRGEDIQAGSEGTEADGLAKAADVASQIVRPWRVAGMAASLVMYWRAETRAEDLRRARARCWRPACNAFR